MSKKAKKKEKAKELKRERRGIHPRLRLVRVRAGGRPAREIAEAAAEAAEEVTRGT